MVQRIMIGLFCVIIVGCNATKDDFGCFLGKVDTTWGGDGRTMTLTEDFAYIDPQGRRWDAPKGSEIDGASIPKVFWSLIGGPFEGRYRNASVVHDVACVQKTAAWSDVHRMFYNACRCGGVEQKMAKAMYYAVFNFGPRWEVVYKTVEGGKKVAVTVPRAMAPPNEDVVRRAKEYFDTHDPSLDEIESLKL